MGGKHVRCSQPRGYMFQPFNLPTHISTNFYLFSALQMDILYLLDKCHGQSYVNFIDMMTRFVNIAFKTLKHGLLSLDNMIAINLTRIIFVSMN